MRPSKDEYYLQIAEDVSRRGTCLRRNYGAVIVKNDEVVSTGYSGAPRGEDNCCDVGVCERKRLNVPAGERYELCRSVHAEMNACIHAARKDSFGATLYLVGIDMETGRRLGSPWPCDMCQRVIKNAGIVKIVNKYGGTMQLDQLRKLFEEEKDYSVLRWPGKCHDCGKEVEVEAFMAPDAAGSIEITGGAVYWPEWHYQAGEKIFHVKCDCCFDKNPKLERAREIEVYSRIVGYLRPIKQWNNGKRAEFDKRTVFNVG